MGQSESQEENVNLDTLAALLFNSEQWHGFKIDSCLETFSGVNSAEKLNLYRDQIIQSDLNQAAATVEKLGSALSGLSMVPNAVGLGALIISMILETVAKTLGKQTMGTAEMLQRVFAQEKANEVRDLMDEYLKRLQINLGNPQHQLAETRQIEIDLSAQLTRLKNSMMQDGHMSTRFLKQWVNGAAFHTQMLIHQARLGGTDGSRAVRAAGIYQQHLRRLLDKYKHYLGTVLTIGLEDDKQLAALLAAGGVYGMGGFTHCCFRYKENQVSNDPIKCFKSSCFSTNALVDHIFSKHETAWANNYFSNLQATIPTLVGQNTTFYLRAPTM